MKAIKKFVVAKMAVKKKGKLCSLIFMHYWRFSIVIKLPKIVIEHQNQHKITDIPYCSIHIHCPMSCVLFLAIMYERALLLGFFGGHSRLKLSKHSQLWCHLIRQVYLFVCVCVDRLNFSCNIDRRRNLRKQRK